MTHNLHILIDSSYNKQINNIILEIVYADIADKEIKRNILWQNENIDTLIHWKKEVINEIESKFMGDLFTTPIHNDSLLYILTKITLEEIEKKVKDSSFYTNWKIIFHISKKLEY
jgi:hypothetical protein